MPGHCLDSGNHSNLNEKSDRRLLLDELLRLRASEIIEAGCFLHANGWVPATSGNFSARLDGDHAAMTRSGRYKGHLTPDDILVVNMQGSSLDPAKTPSAETLLHTTLYQAFPECGAVLHTHSVHATVLSRLLPAGEDLLLQDYEMLKALAGNTTHTTCTRVPNFANTQDMQALSQELAALLHKQPTLHGFLIQGHGLYTWGKDMTETRRHIEAFEFLFECELMTRRTR